MKDLERELRAGARRDLTPAFDRAAARLRAAASARHLLDVAYAMVDSPLGPLLVAATSRGLVRLDYGMQGFDTVLMDLSARVSPRVLEAPERLDTVRRELDEYFDRRRRSFDLRLDWRLIHGFHAAVLRQTKRIPYGEVSTYRQVATRAGSPMAVRAAGNALASNPIPIVIPCHRVLRTGSGLGGYGGGLDKKEKLLALEGVEL